MSAVSPEVTANVKSPANECQLASGYLLRMDVFDIRRRNLAALIRSFEAQGLKKRKEQAQRLGMSSSFLSQLLKGKRMGDEVARGIEFDAFQAHGWMDRDHGDPLEGEALPVVTATDIRTPPTVETLMAALAPRLRGSTPYIRSQVGKMLMDYATSPDDGEEIAQAIQRILEPDA